MINKLRKKVLDFFYFEKAYIIAAGKKEGVLKNTAFSVVRVNDENLNDAAWFNSKEQLQVFRKYLNKSYAGYYGYVGNRCVFRIWRIDKSEDATVGKGFRLMLKDEQCFVSYGLTAEDFRGLGIFPHAMDKMIAEMPYTEILGYVHKDNASSIRGLKKAGFVIKRTIRMVRLQRLAFSVTKKPNSPGVSFSFGDRLQV